MNAESAAQHFTSRSKQGSQFPAKKGRVSTKKTKLFCRKKRSFSTKKMKISHKINKAFPPQNWIDLMVNVVAKVTKAGVGGPGC